MTIHTNFSHYGKWAVVLFIIFGSETLKAQESDFLKSYRKQVVEYNQDVKSAGYAVLIREEQEKSAKADFLPALSADGTFNFTGNPTELSLSIPNLGTAKLEGKNMKYGASLTLAQPLYMGGALKAKHQKSKKETEMAAYEKQRLVNDILYDADTYYWNAVAQAEMVKIAEEYKASVSRLVEVVRHRVEEEYTDRNDLLMVEVKLNEADYRLLQSQKGCEVARLSLNSFAGIEFGRTLPTDSVVIPLKVKAKDANTLSAKIELRPEWQIAQNRVAVQKEQSRIDNARFLPKITIGLNGSYQSPGYDFRADMDPNYAVYAKISIPLFEWGKRKNTHRAGKHSINMALQNQYKVEDQLRLEIETAYYTYAQSIDKVVLTENSLQKASESESLAIERYKEGNISIVEVINAQLYHQEAQVNYIQSKLEAQIARSSFERAIGTINK